ncbi:hypothetical protein PspLS_06280 [Pyricularia sp. CBS 133598]|nr:hypothetical protein PspLS_06280 [Pyricularia sp. CBS 133598]
MALPEDYTVGIICAIGFEMSAVRYMLDKEHPRLPRKNGSDSNIYTFGELSGHNVILACLSGNQGKGAAAIVATNMTRSFPSIKWRFLGPYGGVVQYDLGKDEEDGFRLKGFLSVPPSLLRNTVDMMRSDHFVQQNKIQEYLSTMLKKGPRFSVYTRPTAHTDILFDATYAHASIWSICDGCDKTKVVSRPPRQGPEIHYGLIALGDSVMRSATKRNQKVHDVGDILCFEMEAAGLMTEYSCIIIRGISDYADSHKKDGWQHCAAAVAAACAKELLLYVDPETSSGSRTGDMDESLSAAATAHNRPGADSSFRGRGI